MPVVPIFLNLFLALILSQVRNTGVVYAIAIFVPSLLYTFIKVGPRGRVWCFVSFTVIALGFYQGVNSEKAGDNATFLGGRILYSDAAVEKIIIKNCDPSSKGLVRIHAFASNISDLPPKRRLHGFEVFDVNLDENCSALLGIPKFTNKALWIRFFTKTEEVEQRRYIYLSDRKISWLDSSVSLLFDGSIRVHVFGYVLEPVRWREIKALPSVWTAAFVYNQTFSVIASLTLVALIAWFWFLLAGKRVALEEGCLAVSAMLLLCVVLLSPLTSNYALEGALPGRDTLYSRGAWPLVSLMVLYMYVALSARSARCEQLNG